MVKNNELTTSLIITTYNRPDALEAVLQSVLHQEEMPNEVVIADDGSTSSTKSVIEYFQNIFPIPLKHSWQEDEGFRASQSRNKALALCEYEYVILIDGDMVLHPKFVSDHKKVAKRQVLIQGGRVVLTPEKTRELLKNPLKYRVLKWYEKKLEKRFEKRFSALRIPFVSNLILKKETKNYQKIRSCNMAFFREEALKINGFNNDFVGWGREDSEFVVRFLNNGGKRANIKYSAIAYHLWHKEEKRDSLPKNDKLLADSIEKHLTYCENGINVFLSKSINHFERPKICIVSKDSYNIDYHICKELKLFNLEVTHINIENVTYKNIWERVLNFCSKKILKENLKNNKRQNYVIEKIKKLEHQDQILVLSPFFFEKPTLQFLKSKTNRLITFLYDSLERYPVQDKLHFFDKVFSFEDADVEKYHFEHLTNYIYLPYLPKEKQHPTKDILYITSDDKKRVKQMKILSRIFSKMQLKFIFFVIGKKFWMHRIAQLFSGGSIFFKKKQISNEDLPRYYKDAKVILDLRRHNQYGLSFRIFDAMALEKKIITDNEIIKKYDFYNPDNILILNEDFTNLTHEFFEIPYQSLPKEIYEKYTLREWVKKVFDFN